jgi:hypothetical protein
MADAQLRLEDDVKAAALRTPDIEQLVSEHQNLDERIRHLSTQTWLTEQQQLEEVELKKRKLALKDRIEAIRHGRPLRAGLQPSQ